MKQPAVLLGVGEMGGVFARGLLRLGHPVFPVIRSMQMQDLAAELPDPEMVLIAVAENDLQPVLRQVPENWRTRLTRALEHAKGLGLVLPTLEHLQQESN